MADGRGALGEGFDLGSQAIAAPDALLLGVAAQVGSFLRVEGFCDELRVGALAFVVGAAESQVGDVWGDARVVAAEGIAGVAGPGVLARPRDPTRACRIQLDVAIAGQQAMIAIDQR